MDERVTVDLRVTNYDFRFTNLESMYLTYGSTIPGMLYTLASQFRSGDG